MEKQADFFGKTSIREMCALSKSDQVCIFKQCGWDSIVVPKDQVSLGKEQGESFDDKDRSPYEMYGEQ